MKRNIFFIFQLLGLLVFLMNNLLSRPFPKNSAPPLTVIDVHSHLFGRITNNNGITFKDYEGAVENALSKMDKSGIKKMLIMPPPFPPEHKDIYEYDEFKEVLNKYPERFGFLGGGGTLNVMLQKYANTDIMDEIKKEFEKTARKIIADGAVGFGEIACEHLCLGKTHNHQQLSPDNPLLLLLADISAELNVPIDIHMEAVTMPLKTPERLFVPPNPEMLTENISAFEKLLSYNPKAKIIWDHVGWDQTGMRSAELTDMLLSKHPNLFMSIKICTTDCPIENCMIDNDGNIRKEWLQILEKHSDRFMIGCDEFIMSPKIKKKLPPSIKDTINLFAKLPKELKRKIAFENARRIFNLH
ncbi:MAG: amidohydrolase family protein [Elusimicrobia bacterium]|nr:amidohydrolase family protein [Elusimicrobiota bacterium]